jgi:hypothetical protein
MGRLQAEEKVPQAGEPPLAATSYSSNQTEPASASDLDEHYWSSVLGSVGEESGLEAHLNDDLDDFPELNVESVHTFIGSVRHQTAGGIPKPKVPWHQGAGYMTERYVVCMSLGVHVTVVR